MSKTAGKALRERYGKAAFAELAAHMDMIADGAARQQLAAEHRQRLTELRLKMEQAVTEYETAWHECRAEMIQVEKRCIEASTVFSLSRAQCGRVFQDVMRECDRLVVAPESVVEP